ncbi:MAG TPA: hypothetical protein DCP90_00050 [Clostridiales bacterium]|nr:MAG: hypothetical protein A2Y22_02635 [Clostridiales bacterium GWD2_32_59]HAN08986.1 hypothetical protein [Clostridiales bacterium]
MKQSKFNHVFKNEKDEQLAYNGVTNSLANVNIAYFEIVDEIEKETFDYEMLTDERKKVYDTMKKNGYIIDDNVDEMRNFKHIRNLVKYSDKTMSLTIAPTLDCNLRCTYCYENRRKGIMTEEIEEEIFKFVEKRKQVLKSLNITWYGGEPLLAKDIIWRLSEKIIKMCEENSINYSSNMISNGVLIDEETANNLEKYKIKSIQITIDGDKETHNKRRIYIREDKDGYSKIITVLKILLKTSVLINIRVNIDKDNKDSIDGLLDDLKQIEGYERLMINFAKVTSDTDACKSVEGSCVTTEEFVDLEIELVNKVKEKGLTYHWKNLYPYKRIFACGTENINSLLIDEVGDVYKCLKDIGIVKNKISNLRNINKDSNNMLCNNYFKWIEYDALDNVKCKECKLLFSCLGGCPYGRVMKKKEPECTKIKYNFEKIVKYINVK